MSVSIRLVVADGDGTLVRGDKSLSDEVAAAVKRVTRAGVSVSLISARPPSGRYAGMPDRVDKLVGVSDDHSRLRALDAEIAVALGSTATVARSQPYYLDIAARRANKGDGLTTLATAYGVPLGNVAVLGDQRNDLPMFACAGLSLARGQALEEVRAAADHVVRSNEADGVADASDRILPGRQRRSGSRRRLRYHRGQGRCRFRPFSPV